MRGVAAKWKTEFVCYFWNPQYGLIVMPVEYQAVRRLRQNDKLFYISKECRIQGPFLITSILTCNYSLTSQLSSCVSFFLPKLDIHKLFFLNHKHFRQDLCLFLKNSHLYVCVHI